jgi:translation initiation factor 2D
MHMYYRSAGRSIAPLRTSDRRKLKQRVVQEYGVAPELGDLLVPDGLMSQKVATCTNVPSVSIRIISRFNR